MNDDETKKLKEVFDKAAEDYNPGAHEWVEILRATRDMVAIIAAIAVVQSPESETKKRWEHVLGQILVNNTLKDIAFSKEKIKPRDEYNS